MLPTQTIVALVPVILLLICLSIPIIRQLDAQVIRLRGPEQSSPFAFLRPAQANNNGLNANEPFGLPSTASTPAPRPAPETGPKNERPPPNINNRRPPKAGNLIVRFDPDHEIQRLEYDMRDGRLATVYSRNRSKQQQPHARAEPQVQARQQSVARSPEEPPQTLLGQPSDVGQSSGDKIGPVRPQADAKQQQHGQIRYEPEPVVATIDLNESDIENAESLSALGESAGDKGEILATIVGGLVKNAHQSGGPKLTKAKGIMAKIRSKLSQLPQLIEKNLQAKSSLGKAYIDHESGPQERPGPTLVYGRIPYPGQADKQQQQQQQQQQQKQIPSGPPALPALNQALYQLDAPLRQEAVSRPGPQNGTPINQQDNLSPQKLLSE